MKREMLKRMVALSIALSVIPCGMASAEKAVVQEGTEDSTKWTAIVVKGGLDSAKDESAQVGFNGYGSIAIGNGAKANVDTDLGADNAIAIGTDSNAAGTYGIAVGLKADATAYNTTAIGTQSGATDRGASAFGAGATASGEYSLAEGYQAKASEDGAIAEGYQAVASGASAIAIGSTATASKSFSVAIGINAEASGLVSLAVGDNAEASGVYSLAEGYQAVASGESAIAEGYSAEASGEGAIAIGTDTEASGKYSLAEGHFAVASEENATALGNDAQATHKNSVALGAGSVTAEADSVSIGNGDKTRKLQFVTDGAVSADSTDAVNGSQLYAAYDAINTNKAIEDMRHATFIATATDLDSRITAEVTARQEAIAQEAITRDEADTRLQTQIDTKADAATEDARHATFIATATDLDKRITAEVTARQEAIAQEAITRDAADTRLQSQIDTKADAATEDARHATFIATATDLDKRITAEATARQEAIAQEAITRDEADTRLQSQIDTNAMNIQQNASGIMNLGQQLNTLDRRVDKVGAGAAALAALHPLDYDPENKLSFAAGLGNYGGATAAAVGAFYRPNQNMMFSIGGTAGNGENMFNVGASFAIGKGGSGVAKLSKAELVQVVKDVKAENSELRHEINNAKADNQKLQERIAKLEEMVLKLAGK